MNIKIKAVYPSENLNIIVIFKNDVIKKYDVRQLFRQLDWYRDLENPDIFNLVHVDCGGCGVVWNEDIDISECELWENGIIYESPFAHLMSFSEAASLWGIDDSTLRKAAADGRLCPEIDIKKFGKQWVVTEQAMKKTFGQARAQI